MQVLLSIKPEFANLIFSGKKKYEYRKQIFKKDVTSVVVYASFPVQKIIGEFTIDDIEYDNIDQLWQKTEAQSGITFEYFSQYFTNKETGYAIKVADTILYTDPIDLHEVYPSSPPQSFAYLR